MGAMVQIATNTARISVAIVLLACAALNPDASAATPVAIRTGGPSAPQDTKVAIIGTSNVDPGGSAFEVLDATGHVVLRGELRPARGHQSPWPRAFVADLTAIKRPGAYRVRVGPTTSRPWVVRAGAPSAPIKVILEYFAANSD